MSLLNLTQRILIVEDELDHLDLYKLSLSKLKTPVLITHAATVATAKALLKQEVFDLMIIDYQLTDGLGTEVIQFIKENRICGRIIVVTGFGSEAIAVSAMKNGAYDYLVKSEDAATYLGQLTDSVDRAFGDTPCAGSMYMLAYKMGNAGPEAFVVEEMPFFTELRSALAKIGVYYYTAVAQGGRHIEGLYGPFPSVGDDDQHDALVFTASVPDESQTDERLGKRNYLMLVLLYPKSAAKHAGNRADLARVLEDFIAELDDVSELDLDGLHELKERLVRAMSS